MLKELIARIEELAIADADARRHLEKQDWELRNHKESLASADALRKSLNDEIIKRDRELREMDAEAKAHREVMQKKDAEIQEWLMQLANARNERDAALREAESLRSQVPLESTREALKNTVAKLREVTTDRDRVLNELAAIVAEANKTGRCGGDPVALLKQGQVDRDTAESLDRQLGAALALSNERAQEIRKLIDGHAEDMKAQAELTAQLDSAKGEAEEWIKQCHAARRQRDEVKAAARKETQRLSDLCARRGVSIETLSVELSRRYAEIAGLREWATGVVESGGFADNYPERTMHYRHIVARINSRPQLDLTATLPTVDWQVVARNLEQTIAGLNAKVAELQGELDKQKTQADSMERQVGGLTRTRLRLEFERDKMKAKLEPLEALYKTLKGWQENDHIIGYGLAIDTAINKATEAFSQLTA